MNFLLVNLKGIISLQEMLRTLVMITIYAASAKKAMLRDAWIEKMKKTSQNSKALISGSVFYKKQIRRWTTTFPNEAVAAIPGYARKIPYFHRRERKISAKDT